MSSMTSKFKARAFNSIPISARQGQPMPSIARQCQARQRMPDNDARQCQARQRMPDNDMPNAMQPQAWPTNAKHCQARPLNPVHEEVLQGTTTQCPAMPSTTTQWRTMPITTANAKKCQARPSITLGGGTDCSTTFSALGRMWLNKNNHMRGH